MPESNSQDHCETASRGSSNGAVVVCGANGYIGTHLIARLKSKGTAVKCLLRPGSGTSGIEESVKETDIVRCDLSGSKPPMPSLIEALSGAGVLVNLIGSIAPRRGESLDSMHVQTTVKLISLCHACRIPKMIMLTALGTGKNAPSKYHLSKWRAEQELEKSGLAYIILRPSLVYGRQTGHRDSKLVKRFIELINSRPVVPLIGGGHNRLQPIFVGDLVQCIEAGLAAGQHDNHAWELGGPETVELRQFIEMLMRRLEQIKPFMDMPVAVARSIAAVCELTQEVPTLSQDQVTLTLTDNICKHNALQEIFQVSPTGIADGMQSYATHSAVPVGV